MKVKRGVWVNTTDDAPDLHSTLQRTLRGFIHADKAIVEIPMVFNMRGITELFDQPLRMTRFVEQHCMPLENRLEYRQIMDELYMLIRKPGKHTAESLGDKLYDVYQRLAPLRKSAYAAVQKQYSKSRTALRLTVPRQKCKSRRLCQRVAEQILEFPATASDATRQLESPIEIVLQLEGKDVTENSRVNTVLKGLLLVSSATGLGMIVFDRPEQFFQSMELVETIAPVLLANRDRGVQCILSTSDVNVPIAFDADLLWIFDRQMEDHCVGKLNEHATGSFNSPQTLRWAMRRLDGGAQLVSIRQNIYKPILSEQRAKYQKKVSELSLNK